MNIAIAIASVGRPAILGETLRRLARQTREPDRLLVVAVEPSDLPAGGLAARAEAMFAPRGSTRQRNAALDRLGATADVLVFLDDDFVCARDFVAGVEELFSQHDEIVCASGHLIADGAMGPGFDFAEADRMIERYEHAPRAARELIDDTGAYGCNMAVRLSAAPAARFDENLPLYAWLEDTDYTAHFARAGRAVRTNAFAGVHLGAKSGRTPGVRLGYSQIANPLYLVGKGTLDARRALRMATGNILANAAKSLRPEPYIDRVGRLKGNLIALADIARGRSDPRRILDL